MGEEMDGQWVDFVPKRILLNMTDCTLAKVIEYGLRKCGYVVNLSSISPQKDAYDIIIQDEWESATLVDSTLTTIVIRDLTQDLREFPTKRNLMSLDKPFDFEHLLHMIQSHLPKNIGSAHALQVPQTQRAIRLHHVEVYDAGMEIQCFGYRVALTWREYHVFLALLQEHGSLVEETRLIEKISERISNQRTSLTQSINKLRRKLNCCSDHVQILTQKKEGYRLQISI